VAQWNGRPLRIVSVHPTGTYQFSLVHALATSERRMREAADLRRRAAAWSEDLLVAGDFNALPGTGMEEQLRGRLTRVPTSQPTYPSTSPALQIDHVYCSDDLSAKPGPEQTSLVSDHLPVVVAVERRPSTDH
jgi:endonuclease/exonuclease/phosphatase family metal-dependent hydrolase